MRKIPTNSEAKPAPSKPADAKLPDIAEASVPDTLAALQVNPDTVLAETEVNARRVKSPATLTPPQKSRSADYVEKYWN